MNTTKPPRLFSERKGLKKVRDTIQRNNIGNVLRNHLWDEVCLCILDKVEEKKNANVRYISVSSEVVIKDTNLYTLFEGYWRNLLEKTLDRLPQFFDEAREEAREHFLGCEWKKVYDFIEFTAQHCPEHLSKNFIESCNQILERENSAYRFVNCMIADIDSEEERKSTESAINSSSQYPEVQEHLIKAVRHLSNRKSPDYENSAKESISAVESLCKSITKSKKATLGEALKHLPEDYQIHPIFKEALSKLYGSTSNYGGIRHGRGQHDKTVLTCGDARFMLAVSSSFVNYILIKGSEKKANK